MQNNHLDFINQINLLKLQFSKIGIQVKSLISVLNVMIVMKAVLLVFKMLLNHGCCLNLLRMSPILLK